HRAAHRAVARRSRAGGQPALGPRGALRSRTAVNSTRMTRIIILIVLAAAIYFLFRSFFRAQVEDDRPPPATSIKGEDMVACARCGVNLPRSEASEEAGRLVCQNNPQCH